MTKLDEYRKELDQIDETIIKALEHRMRTVEKIAQYKMEHQVPVLDAMRERAILDRITKTAAPDMAFYTRTLYNNIMEMSKDHQRKAVQKDTRLVKNIRCALEETPKVFPATADVACTGSVGSYGQQACDKLFRMPQIMYMKNVNSVFAALEQGLCRYGVLPVEASSAGSINEIYSLLMKYGFYIVKSVKVKTTCSLMARRGRTAECPQVIFASEEAALQCDDYLKKFPKTKLVLCRDGADAAKGAAESEEVQAAALTSYSCGQLYGLVSMEENVQDQDQNYTRFICISKELEIYPGADRTSLKVEVSHQPGALYNLLSRFNSLGIHILKLESRPVSRGDEEHMFYIDINTSVYADEFIRLMNQLEESTKDYKYFGSYMEI